MLDVSEAFRRAYPAQSARQQNHDRLVHTADELARVLGLALQVDAAQRPSTIRLGQDIALDAPLVLAGSYNVVIDGGGRYRISASASFAGTELLQFTGAVGNILFRDLGFTGPTSKLERLLLLGGTATGVNFERVQLAFIKRIHESTSSRLWQSSSFVDVSMASLALSDTTSIGSAQYKRCLFRRCYASLPSSTTRVISIGETAGSEHLIAEEALLSTSTSAVQLLDFDVSQLYALKLSDSVRVDDGSATPGASSFSQLLTKSGAIEWVLQGRGTTSGATSVTIASFTPAPSKSFLVTARIIGHRTNGSDPGQTNTYVITQQFKTSAAGVVTVGAVLSSVSTTDDGTWTTALDTSAGDIRIRAAGVAGQNITWTTTVTIDEN